MIYMLNLDLEFGKLIQPGLPAEEYQRMYDELVEFAMIKHPGTDRELYGEYLELHHILPRSVGTNDEQNLVLFTAREHILAHLLLALIHRGEPSYVYVAWCMLETKDIDERWKILERLCPSWWSWLRDDYRKLCGKAVAAIGDSDEVVGVWESHQHLKSAGFSISSVRQVLSGQYKRSGGWRWTRLEDLDPEKVDEFLAKGEQNVGPREAAHLTREEQRRRQPGSTEVVAFLGDGEIHGVYPSMGSVVEAGFNPRHLPEVLRGDRKSMGGYKWMKGIDFIRTWPNEYINFKMKQ